MIFKILIKIIKRYWDNSYSFIIIASFLNIVLAIFESLSVILLPSLINYDSSFEKFKLYNLNSSNGVSISFFILCFTLIYILILGLIYICRNLCIFYSSKFANKISISYSLDFLESFSRQGLDQFNDFPKDKFNTYIQAKFPLISREVFFPLTQILSSFMITVVLVFSAISLSAKISIILISLVALIYFYVSYFSSNQLKRFGKIINVGLYKQGYFGSLFYDSLSLFRNNKNKLSFKNLLLNNEENIKSAQTKNLIFTSLPKNTIEFFVLTLIVSIMCFLNLNSISSISNNLLISLIFALLKSILSLQQFSRSIYLVQSNRANILDIENMLSNFKRNKLQKYYKYNQGSNDNSLIKFKGVEINLKSKTQKNISIDFSIIDNDIILIDGPSGIGKTRLLNFISGNLPQIKGDIIFNKKTFIEGYPGLYLIPQKQLFTNCLIKDFLRIESNLDIINFENKLKKLSKICQCKEEFFYELISINVIEFLSRSMGSLSGGQLQRVSILACLIQFPRIMILDEPFSAVDSECEKNYFNILKNYILNTKNSCIVYTTHNENAKLHCNKVFNLSSNQLEN